MKPPAHFLCVLFLGVNFSQAALPVGEVEGQPLGANVGRLIQALDFLGAPLPEAEVKKIKAAIVARDAAAIQTLVDPYVLVAVSLNPEVRVKVQRGRLRQCCGRAGSRRSW